MIIYIMIVLIFIYVISPNKEVNNLRENLDKYEANQLKNKTK
jgi:hypothetical protein